MRTYQQHKNIQNVIENTLTIKIQAINLTDSTFICYVYLEIQFSERVVGRFEDILILNSQETE